jgi:hypothetical protein
VFCGTEPAVAICADGVVICADGVVLAPPPHAEDERGNRRPAAPPGKRVFGKGKRPLKSVFSLFI